MISIRKITKCDRNVWINNATSTQNFNTDHYTPILFFLIKSLVQTPLPNTHTQKMELERICRRQTFSLIQIKISGFHMTQNIVEKV